MSKFKEYETFRLIKPIEGGRVPVGARGVVLIVHKSSPPAYEVEFCDQTGATLALVTLSEDSMGADPVATPQA